MCNERCLKDCAKSGVSSQIAAYICIEQRDYTAPTLPSTVLKRGHRSSTSHLEWSWSRSQTTFDAFGSSTFSALVRRDIKLTDSCNHPQTWIHDAIPSAQGEIERGSIATRMKASAN